MQAAGPDSSSRRYLVMLLLQWSWLLLNPFLSREYIDFCSEQSILFLFTTFWKMILFFTNIATLSKSRLLFWCALASTLCVCFIFHSAYWNMLSFFAVALTSFMKITNSCLDLSPFTPAYVGTLNTPDSLVAQTVLLSPFLLVFFFQLKPMEKIAP